MNPEARARALEQTELEIKQEMAAALGRIGRRLLRLNEELAILALDIAELDGEARLEKVKLHFEKRIEAKKYFYYFLVQREAIGFRNHDLPDSYHVPPAVD